jgi:hypothetical protein
MTTGRFGVLRSFGTLPLVWLVVGALGIGLAAGCNEPAPPPQGPTPANDREAQTLADFNERVGNYVLLHRKHENTLPELPKEANPKQIDARQRNLNTLMADARRDAKQGDLFTPEMQTLIRDHLKRVFRAQDGEDLKGSVMDENPMDITLAVNQRYPDEVPMSTMPPEVLQILPKMPEELEYRFVARHLVILDVHAHLIADYVPNAIP